MDQRDFVKLTSALYRVTDLFPNQEPLRFGLRERSLKILGLLSPYHFSDDTNLDSAVAEESLKEVQALRSLLAVSQGQQWVSEINLILLDQEYGRLEDRLEHIVKHQSGSVEKPIDKPEPKSDQASSYQDIRPQKSVLHELKPNRTYDLNTGREVDSPLDKPEPKSDQASSYQDIRPQKSVSIELKPNRTYDLNTGREVDSPLDKPEPKSDQASSYQDIRPQKSVSIELKPNRTYDLNTGREVDLPPTERQQKILQMIRQHPRIQMHQIQEELPDVTSRTLRRDLEALVQRRKIVRVGRGTGTFYRVNFVDNS